MTTMLELRAFLLFNILAIIISIVLAQNLPTCDTNSSSSGAFFCDKNQSTHQICNTYAFLRANPYYSSLFNLTSYLAIAPADLAEANGFPADSDRIFSDEQPLLIPINCECSSSSGLFEAQVRKITVEGDSFNGIAESLEGLTTCKAIKEKNPRLSPWNLEERINLSVPLECSCPSPPDSTRFLLSYPVREGDSLPTLALRFNVSTESIVSANNRYSKADLKPDSRLIPLSTLVIPLQEKPIILGSIAKSKPQDAVLGYPATSSIHVGNTHKRRRMPPKMLMLGVYIAVGVIGLIACIAIAAAFLYIHLKRKRDEDSIKNGDLELQQLSLSIRTTSDNKVSFEGSQYNLDDHVPADATTTPHKMRIDNYTFEELQKATEDFGLSNLIEGSVYHGRLKGKNLAIKRVASDTISKIDYDIFQDRTYRHPNTIRLLGTCLTEGGPDSYLVLEYAKNGSLKDWIHGGLAIKSQFIASCNCFLTWNQRVKICLDVATALQYMHHIMNPCYVHRNIKSRNIFLDEDFTAKVGNFGMSKCGTHTIEAAEDQEGGQSGSATAWNAGYLPAEYLKDGTVSPSTDVFAYGVVLLEILSGKAPITHEEGKTIKLSDEIKHILQSEDAEQLRGWMDCSMGEKYSFDAALLLANLARTCVDDDPSLRPTAGEIVEKLLRLAEELPEEEQFNIPESSTKPLVRASKELT